MPKPEPDQMPLGGGRLWTTPIPGSTYPLSLAADGTDPSSTQVRLFGLIGAAIALGAFLIVPNFVNLVVMSVSHALGAGDGESLSEFMTAAQKFENVWGLLAAHLGLASMVLAGMAMFRVVHRRRDAWLWSVSPGMRWRYLLIMLVVATIVLNGVLLIAGGVPGVHPQPGAAVWLAVIAVTAPLQALGEEVFFRGYLLLALGMIWRNEIFAVVGSALVFALFHGTQNLPLFLQRFAFGVLAGLLVWRTGGLEAAIGAHVANNVWAFTWAVLTSSVAEVRAVQELGWVSSLREVGGFALVAIIGLLIARRMRVPRVVAGGLG